MTDTGFWQASGGPSPWGPMDVDASLNFSFDLSGWLAAAGTGLTLASAEFLLPDDSPLAIGAPTLAAGRVTARFSWSSPDPLPALNSYHPFTLRFVASDGQQDDRTFNLRYVQR